MSPYLQFNQPRTLFAAIQAYDRNTLLAEDMIPEQKIERFSRVLRLTVYELSLHCKQAARAA